MTKDEFDKTIAEFEAGDAGRLSHERFRVRHELGARLSAESSAPEVHEAHRFEAAIFLGYAAERPRAYGDFPEVLRSDAGLQWASGVVRSSRSCLTRAPAGWLLWQSPRTEYRRQAHLIASAHVEMAEVLLDRLGDAARNGAAIEAVNALACAVEVSRLTSQTKHFDSRLRDAGLRFAARVSTRATERWLLDVGGSLSALGAAILSDRLSELSELVARLEVLSEASDYTFLIRRGMLEAAQQLREALSLPESTTHGRAAIAILLEEDGLVGEPLRGLPSLREALSLYRQLKGHGEAVARVARLIEERTRMAQERMPLVATDVAIPTRELEAVWGRYRAAPVREALRALARDPELRLDPLAMQEYSRDADGEFLHRQFVSTTLMHGDGTSLRPSGDEEQRAMRAAHDAALEQQCISGLFLTPVFRELTDRGMTSTDVVEVILEGELVDSNERPFIERGVRHWASGDWISSLSVLVPRLERVLRVMATRMGLPTLAIRADRDDRVLLSSVLDRLEAHPGDEMFRSLIFELRIYLDGGGGRAIRHQVAHGLAEAGHFSQTTADTLIALLLRIGACSRQGSAASRPDGVSAA